jgi:hypothetical protein
MRANRVGVTDLCAKHIGRPVDERNDAERRKRETPIGHQHHDADREEREQVAEARDDSGREQLVE